MWIAEALKCTIWRFRFTGAELGNIHRSQVAVFNLC